MNLENWSKARSIFERAIDLQTTERAAYLAKASGGDEALTQLVQELLEAHEDTNHVLEPPTGAQLGAMGLGDSEMGIDIPGVPERIGAYRIVGRIGAGGMGTIYEAQQDSPQRSVALKIMREGFSTERVRGRFLFEAEVLGRLQHENIARVLESGIHVAEGSTQLPWFALEYVKEAQSILQFAASRSLSIEARVKLFLLACSGVQHGHQKGVIHRDLKASNILVGPDGSPKVIDFGVACLVESEGDAEVEWTLSGEVVGTLGAMSPEQLRGSRGDVDICTDVYSLGALLFELLAGEPALDLKGLSLPAAFEQARKGELRGLRELKPELPRELEWIVQRAMEFDRGDRYSSVSELAADLNRFQAKEPVLAGPHTNTYHFKKFVSRNRLSVLAAAIVLLVLVGALAWVSAIYQIADHERTKSAAINEFMSDTLSAADPRVEGPDTKVVDVLDRVFELSAERFAAQPEVRTTLLGMVGRIYHSLGEFELSRKHLEEAIAVHRKSGEPDDESVYRMMALSGLNLIWEETDPEGAVAINREAYEGLLRVLSPDDYETLVAQNILGFALSEAYMEEEAEQHLRESYERASRLWGAESSNAGTLGSRLGQFLQLVGRGEEAEALARTNYEAHKAEWGADHPDTLASGNNLAGILLGLGRASEGLALMKEVQAKTRAIMGADRETTQRQAIVLGNVMMGARDFEGARVVLQTAVDECIEHFGEMGSLTLQARLGLGTAAYYSGDLAVAESEMRLAIEAQEQTIGPENENTITTRNNFGMMLQASGKLKEAEQLLRVNLEIRRKKHGGDNPGTLGAIHNLGFLLTEDGRLEEARPLVEEALAGRRKVLGDLHPKTLLSIMGLARLLQLAGEPAAAIPLWQEVLKAGPKVLGEGSPHLESCRKAIEAARATLQAR